MSETTEKAPIEKKPIAKDRKFILVAKNAPLTYMLASKGTKRLPLLYYDEEMRANRSLRYARNQKSPFEDEQDGFAIVEPIVFENGLLVAPFNDQVLQRFLDLHPAKGVIFRELDEAKEAEQVIKEMEQELSAWTIAAKLTSDKAQILARVILGNKALRMSPTEIKRDLIYFARTSPSQFLEYLDDPELNIRDAAMKAMEAAYFVVKNGKDVFLNFNDNKRKLGTVPFGGKPVDLIVDYLKTDEGVEFYKMLKKM